MEDQILIKIDESLAGFANTFETIILGVFLGMLVSLVLFGLLFGSDSGRERKKNPFQL